MFLFAQSSQNASWGRLPVIVRLLGANFRGRGSHIFCPSGLGEGTPAFRGRRPPRVGSARQGRAFYENLDCNDWNSTGTNEVGGTSEFFLLGFPCELLVGGSVECRKKKKSRDAGQC